MWLDEQENALLRAREADILAGIKLKACAICGEKFRAGENYAWKHKRGKKTVHFCRYNHMRQWEREQGILRDGQMTGTRMNRRSEEEREKRRQREIQRAGKAVAHCDERIAHWTQERLKYRGDAENRKKYKNANSAVNRWRIRRREAEEDLRRAEKGGMP